MTGLAELLGEVPKEEEEYFQSGGEKAPPDSDPEPESEPEAEPPAEKEPPPAEPKEGEAEGEGEDLEPAADEHRRVPLAALREERERRKEMAAKIDAQAAMMARLEGRFQQLLAPQQPEPQRAPTPEEDPIAVLRHLQQERDQRAVFERQQAARAEFEGAVAQREAEFMRQAPDYADAAAYLQQRRDADLQAMGIADPQRRHAVLYQEAAGMAANAMQAGKNPAEVAYNLAKSWGYQPRGQQQQQPAADARIEMAQRAQASSGSLSAGGGRPQSGLTLEGIDAMSDEDFAKLSDAKWRKAWGG